MGVWRVAESEGARGSLSWEVEAVGCCCLGLLLESVPNALESSADPMEGLRPAAVGCCWSFPLVLSLELDELSKLAIEPRRRGAFSSTLSCFLLPPSCSPRPIPSPSPTAPAPLGPAVRSDEG